MTKRKCFRLLVLVGMVLGTAGVLSHYYQCLKVTSLFEYLQLSVEQFNQDNTTLKAPDTSKNRRKKDSQGRTNPYFQNSNVLVLQFGDLDYAHRMKNHTKRNKQWTDCMGYEYRLEQPLDPNSTECMYTQKVQSIHNALETTPNNDWIIFLDLDVQYQAESCDALEMMLPETSVKQSQPCELIS